MATLHTQQTYRELAERIAAAWRVLSDSARALDEAGRREMTTSGAAAWGDTIRRHAETAADCHTAAEHCELAATAASDAYHALTGRDPGTPATNPPAGA